LTFLLSTYVDTLASEVKMLEWLLPTIVIIGISVISVIVVIK